MKLKQALKNKLTKKQLELVPTSFDVVGDILIFADFPEELKSKEKIIGEEILRLFKNIKVVCKKTKKYSGKYRLPKLKILAGERRKETIHKENNIRVKLHVENVYFSARSSNERKRVASLIKKGESVLVMFSGSAVLPINIAKNTEAKEIYGIEINPVAHRYAQENLKLNKTGNITLLKGDVEYIIPRLKKRFDRILMPLPKDAENFLGLASKVAKKNATIHLYTFLEEEKIDKRYVNNYLKRYIKEFKILDVVKCGGFGPGIFRTCIDFRIL